MRARTSITAVVSLMLAGLLLQAQQMEQRRLTLKAGLDWKDGTFVLDARYMEVFSDNLKKRLSSGFTSTLLAEITIFGKREKEPLATGMVQCTVIYDLWEERYFVRLRSPGSIANLTQESLDEVMDTCGGVKGLRLPARRPVGRDEKLRVRLRVVVNPASPELQRKVRAYLANPGGSSLPGSPRSFFGSFSKVFVDEKELRADMIYTYVSQETTIGGGKG